MFRIFSKKEVHIYHHYPDEVLIQILERLKTMPSIEEVKTAVAEATQQVIAAINTAVQTETQQVIDKINSIPVGITITEQDKTDIVNSVLGIKDAATGAIDSITEPIA